MKFYFSRQVEVASRQGHCPFLSCPVNSREQGALTRALAAPRGQAHSRQCHLTPPRIPLFPRNLRFALESRTRTQPSCAALLILVVLLCSGKAGQEHWVSGQVSGNSAGICASPWVCRASPWPGLWITSVQATCIPGWIMQSPLWGQIHSAAGEASLRSAMASAFAAQALGMPRRA